MAGLVQLSFVHVCECKCTLVSVCVCLCVCVNKALGYNYGFFRSWLTRLADPEYLSITSEVTLQILSVLSDRHMRYEVALVYSFMQACIIIYDNLYCNLALP